eukprot:GHUV01038173.1.p1 GENE.GHUV01038173.1~~GHUV01038173.1.p1  ORF type:complete len:139 (+),score=39.47 GHUV01038173.1:685-1101(+)
MDLQVIQERADKRAKSTTEQESIHHFRCIKAAAEQLIPDPLYLYDNISAQKFAGPSDLGITADQRVEMAPNMPDGHQIVEHCFGGFKPWFLEHVVIDAGPGDDSAHMQQLLKKQWKAFGQWYDSKGSLKKNADSLPNP